MTFFALRKNPQEVYFTHSAMRIFHRIAQAWVLGHIVLKMVVSGIILVNSVSWLHLSVGDIQIGERSGKVTVRKGKHSGFREIPLTRDLRYTVNAYLDEHPRKEDTDSPLWLGIRGELKHRSSIFRILNKYTRIAGLPSIGPHILRHTFAYQYLQANPDDIRGLAALLGHSNINTVMIYTQPSLEDLNQRMERVVL